MKTDRDVIERLGRRSLTRSFFGRESHAPPEMALIDVRHRHDDCRARADPGALHAVWRNFVRDGGEPTSVACP